MVPNLYIVDIMNYIQKGLSGLKSKLFQLLHMEHLRVFFQCSNFRTFHSWPLCRHHSFSQLKFLFDNISFFFLFLTPRHPVHLTKDNRNVKFYFLEHLRLLFSLSVVCHYCSWMVMNKRVSLSLTDVNS